MHMAARYLREHQQKVAQRLESSSPIHKSGYCQRRMPIPGNEPGGPWRVALVDDDTGVLRSLSRMLSLCGYEVTTFTSAADFLTSIDQAPPPPEIAVVDLRMPETDGLTLQSLLTERGVRIDRKSTRLNSSHLGISYAVF